MPERRRNGDDGTGAPVRSFWSGTITFGLVSIPVDLFTAMRPRRKSLKMVDKHGRALGRQYHCSKEGRKLDTEDLVRGYETDAGDIIVITDEEFEELAPEMSRDIELRRFVSREQIPPIYYDRPYFLAPAGRSVKAYNLLAKTMERTARVAIGTFVMRGHEYLVAILAENGVLRAETLRRSDEIRSPDHVGLPRPTKAPAKRVTQFTREIDDLTRDVLDMSELEDREAQALQELAESKRERGADVIERADLQDEDGDGTGAQIVDFMEVLRKSLSKKAVVRTAQGGAPGAKAQPTDSRGSQQRGRRRTSPSRHTRRPRAANDLANSSKSELYKVAADLHIAGRSKMDRSELLKAIQRVR